MAPPRRPLVAGNWKMNGLSADLGEIAAVRDAADAIAADLVVCPPATLIQAAAKLCDRSKLALGGQDCHPEIHGAHTGDLSAAMLKDAGASHVIVGHSERRLDHGETDALVSAKAAAALGAGLSVILCVGETRREREAGEAPARVAVQLLHSLPASLPEPGRLAIAYEPVWAIGTGLTPTRADIMEMHAQLRRELTKRLGGRAETVRILYGGSVKPANAAEILQAPDVDGGLVGGASLKAADFLAVAKVYR